MSEEKNSAEELRFHAQEVVRLTRDLELEKRARWQLEKDYEKLRYNKSEAQRFQAACAALTGILSNSAETGSTKVIAIDAIMYGDALIHRLKESGDE